MSTKLSSSFAGTWLLEKNTILSDRIIAICRQYSHLYRIFREYCVGALHRTVWHGLYINTVAANFKAHYIWYRIIALGKVILHHLEEKCTFSKGMLHLLKDSSMFVGVLPIEKKVFHKGKLKKDDKCFFASRGSFIVVFNITFRTRIPYVKFMLHITYTYIPFKKRAVLLFKEILHFWTNAIFCKG